MPRHGSEPSVRMEGPVLCREQRGLESLDVNSMSVWWKPRMIPATSALCSGVAAGTARSAALAASTASSGRMHGFRCSGQAGIGQILGRVLAGLVWKGASSWVACTSSVPLLRSAEASTFPMSMSSRAHEVGSARPEPVIGKPLGRCWSDLDVPAGSEFTAH